MNRYLAAVSTKGVSGFFHAIGHLFDQVTKLGLPEILIVAIGIHFLLTRRSTTGVPMGITLRHYLGILILGVGLANIFPIVSRWFAHLSAGGRGGVDLLVLGIAFSEPLIAVAMNIAARFGGGGGGE